MAGAPRCSYRLAMAHEYLYIAGRRTVAQALLLAASALLPTLAASGPQKRRVETRRGTQKCVRHDSRCEVILALLLSYCGHRRPTHTTICGWASPPAPPNAAGAVPCISGRKPTSRY